MAEFEKKIFFRYYTIISLRKCLYCIQNRWLRFRNSKKPTGYFFWRYVGHHL